MVTCSSAARCFVACRTGPLAVTEPAAGAGYRPGPTLAAHWFDQGTRCGGHVTAALGFAADVFGIFEGTPDEKLDQVARVFADLTPQAVCQLNHDRTMIVCTALRRDGDMHVEKLATNYVPAEVVRHAAMRLGKATHPAESIGEWERWASAWHVIKCFGDGAIAHVDERIGQLEEDGSAEGVQLFRDLRNRVLMLQAKPEAWAGRG